MIRLLIPLPFFSFFCSIFLVYFSFRQVTIGSGITCNVVHPGCVRTDVTRNMNWFMRLGDFLATPIMLIIRKSPAQGAYCSVFAATSPLLDGTGGLYLFNCQKCDPSSASKSPIAAQKLWEVSIQLTSQSEKK